MPTGTIKRTKPRLRVLRGYPGNEPTGLTASAPVKDGVTIKSGQVIQLTWNNSKTRYEWELGCSGTKVPYVAEKDSTDEDVIEADSLTGLSCLGKYELEVAYFKSGDTYNVDVRAGQKNLRPAEASPGRCHRRRRHKKAGGRADWRASARGYSQRT
jgi:hypothetical protein